MKRNELTDALLDAEYAQMGLDRIVKETFIMALICFAVTWGNTEKFKTALTVGIGAFFILTILWYVPIVNKIMLYLCSFIWAFVCGGFIAGFNVIVGIIAGIVIFIFSVLRHKAWLG